MTREEAERIVEQVSCRCDGLGVIPGPHGVTIKCPNCDGKFISNDVYKEALRVLFEEG